MDDIRIEGQTKNGRGDEQCKGKLKEKTRTGKRKRCKDRKGEGERAPTPGGRISQSCRKYKKRLLNTYVCI